MMVCNQGISAYDPASGEVLWKHDWPYDGYRVLQPLLIDAASVVIGTGMGTGTRRIDLKFDEDGKVQVDERWTSRDMKPDYNDYVAYEGNLYGFDRNIFSCVDLETGKRVWKKGRYGHGQVLLLSDAGQLLVLSETGDLVLLRATPERLDELDRMQVLTGKTWNHPVLVGDRLYVRNGEEAACYEMPLQSSAPNRSSGTAGLTTFWIRSTCNSRHPGRGRRVNRMDKLASRPPSIVRESLRQKRSLRAR